MKAVSSSGGTSPASNQASATTQAAAAIAAPTNLTANATSSSQINLNWSPSSTSGVTYNVYSGTTSGATTTVLTNGTTATNFTASNLNPSTTYYFTVKAITPSGGTSPASNQAQAITQAAPAGGACHVTYLDQNDWGAGFTGNLSITNTGSTAINSWVVTWSYAGNQQIYQSWNGQYTQSGHNVQIVNASWNGTINAGSTLTGIGWNANYSATNLNPSVFYLNGVLCK